MRTVGRKLAFVLAASNHGTMIVNRLDFRMAGPGSGDGVGYQILEEASYDPNEIELALQLLELRRGHYGSGVVGIDCGANVGAHTVEWAIAMTGWGSVVAIEAQERLYYALAGNIAINNCFNAIAMNAAVSSEGGVMNIPAPDYLTASSFGSLELKPRQGGAEYIGQTVDYSEAAMVPVQRMTIDSLKLSRVDLIKLDVEGMEIEALEGAKETIEQSFPVLLVESIKVGRETLTAWMEDHGYKVINAGINLLAIHLGDKTLSELKIPGEAQAQSAA